MSLNLRKSVRSLYVYQSFPKYCSDASSKSVYEKEEEGKQPRTVHGKPYPEWRKPWIERKGEWYSKLSVFNLKNPSYEIMSGLQRLPYIDIDYVKKWWKSMKVIQEIKNQEYIPKRVATLGPNLAAVHFFTFRQCAVKLKDSKHWICGPANTLTLPNKYVEGYFVEAVDATNFHHNGIRYEGLQNLAGLNFIKWLCLKDNKHIDVWCLDRIAGQNGKSLEFLDITGLKLSVGCVFALSRLEHLKMLVITDPQEDIPVQAALSLLEEEKPGLLIKIEEPVETPQDKME